MALTIKSLDSSTWDAYAALIERHNGVWGGCWCMGFHAKGPGWGVSAEMNRDEKQALVRAGQAHAALAFDGADCVGWCQFGAPGELPRIKNRRAYEAGLVALPDWRITCFFVDRRRRGEGVAKAALGGALDLIARRGGGTVEAYPESMEGRSTPSNHLYVGTVPMFETFGFERVRPLGKIKWVMSRDVDGR